MADVVQSVWQPVRSDASLIVQAQAGSADAIEELVRRHWDFAYRAAFLVVRDTAAAEDICQESMLAAVGAIASVDPRRPFGAWLHRLVVNRSIDWLRARKRRVALAEAHREAASRAPEQGGQDVSEALDSMAGLEAEDRAIVVLRHLLDYDSKEIGAMLGMPPATVRTRLRRALLVLRQGLDPSGEGVR